VQLRLTYLPRAGEPKGRPRDESLSGVTAPARETNEPLAAGREDVLDGALDHPRGELQVIRNLASGAPVAVQRDDLALTFGELVEDRAGHPKDLGLVLAIDQRLEGLR
jgi:hypothetical protein